MNLIVGQHPTNLLFVPPPLELRPLGLNPVQPPPPSARFMSPLPPPPQPQPQPQQQQDQNGDDEDEDEDLDLFSLASYILNL